VHDAVLEEELGAALDGVRGPRAVRAEAEDRAPAIVERRVRHLGPDVAVPAAVRPLRRDERLGQRVEPRIAAHTDANAGVEGETVLRRAPADAAVDPPVVDRVEPSRLREPGERLLGRGERAGMPFLDPISASEINRQCPPRHFP
jgi:hypothetical protein